MFEIIPESATLTIKLSTMRGTRAYLEIFPKIAKMNHDYQSSVEMSKK